MPTPPTIDHPLCRVDDVYRRRRNDLIPFAEAAAYRVCGRPATRKWMQAFTYYMDKLSRAAMS